jgi:methyl-accepting chemotaxis protein
MESVFSELNVQHIGGIQMSRDPMKPFDDRFSTTKNTGLNDVKDRVSDMTSRVRDKAGEMADTVSEKFGQQRESAADNLERVASTIHDRAGSIPGGPKVANLTHKVADGMESTASYLRGHDLSQMGKDLMDVCRRYPTQSFVAALAIGFLLGRARR